MEDRTVIVVADGAGGVGAGEQAAEFVVQTIQANVASMNSANDWASLLHQTDLQIGDGETTAVVVDIRKYGIAGASVGDSRAWILNHESIIDLTAKQNRKPLLGSGHAEPVGFSNPELDGVLIVATDGLFDYAKRDDLQRVVLNSDFYEITRRCIELVRLPSGELWDDIGIVVARNKPVRQTRSRYEISAK